MMKRNEPVQVFLCEIDLLTSVAAARDFERRQEEDRDEDLAAEAWFGRHGDESDEGRFEEAEVEMVPIDWAERER
jgi:hypothetical protein